MMVAARSSASSETSKMITSSPVSAARISSFSVSTMRTLLPDIASVLLNSLDLAPSMRRKTLTWIKMATSGLMRRVIPEFPESGNFDHSKHDQQPRPAYVRRQPNPGFVRHARQVRSARLSEVSRRGPLAQSKYLAQFKTSHAIHTLQVDRPDRTGIHSCRLKHRGKSVRVGERHGGAVWLRHIEIHLPTRRPDECRKHRFGRGTVMPNQRTDFAAAATRPNNAPRGEAPVPDQPAAIVARSSNPGAEEIRPCRRKDHSVLTCEYVEWHIYQRYRRGRGIERRHAAAITNVFVGEFKAGFAIIVLLRHYAVQSDCARPGTRYAGLPDAKAQPTPAQMRPHDIEAEEREVLVVIHQGENGSRRARELAEQEPVRSGGCKTASVI